MLSPLLLVLACSGDDEFAPPLNDGDDVTEQTGDTAGVPPDGGDDAAALADADGRDASSDAPTGTDEDAVDPIDRDVAVENDVAEPRDVELDVVDGDTPDVVTHDDVDADADAEVELDADVDAATDASDVDPETDAPDDVVEPSDTTDDTASDATPDPDHLGSVEAIVGPAGGELTLVFEGDELAALVIEFPPGALAVDTEIRVSAATPDAEFSASLEPELASPILTFYPSGIEFDEPVRVKMRYDGSGDGVHVFWSALGDDSTFGALPTDIEDDFAEAWVTHFSIGFVARDCSPLCDELECGVDGCGNACATCDGDLVCNDGECVEVEACPSPNICGGCDPLPGPIGTSCSPCGVWACDGEGAVCDDPGPNECGGCATLDGSLGAPCGDCMAGELVCDGAGGLECEGATDLDSDPANCGSCGAACPTGESCIDGACVEDGPCESTCGPEDQCGSDGCGGNCGVCRLFDYESCLERRCERVCGIVGLPSCPTGSSCTDGICVES